jgi:hypothetical protein
MSATTIDPPDAIRTVIECPPIVEVDTRKLFAILTASWKSDMHMRASSDPDAAMKNPAFQMTIELGAKVLPLIFKEYERENDKWAAALCEILRFSPVPPEHYGRVPLIREDWLAWAKAHGYL